VKRGWLTPVGVGALALAVRCLYVWQIHHAPFFDLRLGDGEAYHLWAKRIAAGDWLGAGVFYQAPLYPYFLAIVYRLLDDSVLTVRLVQAAIGAASCVLLTVAGMTMFGRRGALAGIALALYPPGIFLDGLIDKSCLVTFLLCALLALIARERWLAAGLVLGALGLARENALILAIPILWWLLQGRKTRLHAFRFAVACGLVLLLVGVRNLAAGGGFHLTTAQSGPNFYIGNHAGAPGWYDALVVGHGSAADEREDATRLAEQSRGRTLSPGEVSSYWTLRGLTDIRAHPLEWAGLMARKVALTFNAAEVTDTESQDVYAEWSWLLRIPFGFGLVFAVAAANWPGDRRLWTLVFAYALSVALFYVLARYRFPLVPMLLLLAAASPVIASPRRIGWRALAVAVAAFLFAHVPLADARAGRATSYFAIGTAFSKDPSHLDDAVSYYQRALAVDPSFPGAQFGLGTVLTKQGRAEDAIPHYRAALAAWPDYEEARYNFGQALAALGRQQEAVEQYREALRLRPGDGDVLKALAGALLALGRVEEAIPYLERVVELNAGDAAAQNTLGAALANRGRLAEALPHFERAAALNPADANARRNLDALREMLASHGK
jgi:tetratricopeptide (TPR) repeat protein